jgi:hypothetical protein
MPENQKKLNAEYYAREAATLLANPLYKGKFVVIHSQEIKGSFDSFTNALQFATSNLPADEFIIQQVVDENEQINFVRSAI